MKSYDFLENIGSSKDDYKILKHNEDLGSLIEYLDLLVNRNLMAEDFKNILINAYRDKSFSIEAINHNIQKSITTFESIEIKLESIKEELFNGEPEKFIYIGTIDKLIKNKHSIRALNLGKTNLFFVQQLFKQLKGRILTIKEINSLSDILEFKILNVFNVQQLSHKD